MPRRSYKKPARRSIAKPLTPEHPWERQPGETDAAWAGFVAYRDLGPSKRSLTNLASLLHKSRQNFAGWSVSWDWVARCASYDSWVDREVRLAERQAVREMKTRHIGMAMALQGAAGLAINKIIDAEKAKLADGKPGPLTLKPSEVKDLADLGTKLERLTRGEPSEIEDVRFAAGPAGPTQLDYSLLTTEELRTLRVLTRKARGDE